MSKMQLVKNQSGGGLFMAMMVMAALGGMAFIVQEKFIGSTKVIKKDGRIISYQLLVDSVRKNLYSGNSCTQAFASSGSMNLSGAMDFLAEKNIPAMKRGVEVPALAMNLDSSTTMIKKDWVSKTGAKVKSMRFVIEKVAQMPEPYSGDRIVRLPGSSAPAAPLTNLKAVEAYLIIEPDIRGVNVWLPESKKYWIKVYAYINPATNTIQSCYDPNSEVVFCTETLNGVYLNNPSLPAEKRCRPDIGCFTYKSGVIPASTSCPDADYKQYNVGTQHKICTWCPGQSYPLPSSVKIVGTENFVDWNDASGPEVDCNASNPFASMGAAGAWEDYLAYSSLYGEAGALNPQQQAAMQGCLNYKVPCYDDPSTCSNNCGGPPTCNCATNRPDNPATACVNECTGITDQDCLSTQ